ncbi:MAG: 4'-phosphopantetheinyl transferase superfamily protein [Mogibacterium sp.]|nr:4'-phosphopantetheinyl transferase superfamily protein [Mogibacterium sp.]
MIIYYTHKYKELNCESHELLELAIGDYIGNREKAKELVAEMKRDNSHEFEGKPYIEGFDKFSISHSEKSWAVLIDERECGMDIQYERICDHRGIARRFFNVEDAVFIEGLDAEDSLAEFYGVWTKREAFTKALGTSVFTQDFPPFALHTSTVHGDDRYYISNIEIPDGEKLYAAICLLANEDIDEKLIYKEMYVKE